MLFSCVKALCVGYITIHIVAMTGIMKKLFFMTKVKWKKMARKMETHQLGGNHNGSRNAR